MANAFQDQLLKAGLVTKDKLNKTNKARHKQVKQQPKNTVTEADKLKQQIKQTALEKEERDRELNRQKLEEENKNAIAAQIRQLVEMNRVSETCGETVYNFEDINKVKRIYVTDELRNQIVNGRLAIVRLNAAYALVPRIVAEKIMQRDTSFVVLINESAQMGGGNCDVEDEYAEYKVPDDLMW